MLLYLGFAIGLVIFAAYFAFIWQRMGKNPLARHIACRRTPPDTISPATARYLLSGGNHDARTLGAAILYLEAQGLLTITDRSGEYTLHRCYSAHDDGLNPLLAALRPGTMLTEQKLVEVLEITPDDLPHQLAQSLRAGFPIGREEGAISLAITPEWLAMRNADGHANMDLLLAAMLVPATNEPTCFGKGHRHTLHAAFEYQRVLLECACRDLVGANNVAYFLGGIGLSSLAMFYFPFVLLALIPSAEGRAAPITALILVLLNVASFFIMKPPSGAAHTFIAEIKGFAQFIAEESREKPTESLMPVYLPYAYALDLCREWLRRFDSLDGKDTGGDSWSLRQLAAQGVKYFSWKMATDFPDSVTNSISRQLEAAPQVTAN